MFETDSISENELRNLLAKQESHYLDFKAAEVSAWAVRMAEGSLGRAQTAMMGMMMIDIAALEAAFRVKGES